MSCRILHRDYFHNDFLFVRPAVATDYLDSSLPSYRVYYPVADGLQKSLIRMVADFGLALPFEDLPRDTRLLARAAVKQLRAQLPRHVGRRIASDCQIHALGSLFFRNKGAYIVGRLINQTTVYPSPWRYAQPGRTGDAGRAAAGRRRPEHAVQLHARLFPGGHGNAGRRGQLPVHAAAAQAATELYTMIGLQKQGKTLFYRDFLHHLAHLRARLRHRARHQGHGDVRVHAAVLSLCVR